MQRLLALLVSLVAIHPAQGQAEYYINNTTVTAMTPIDALNVVNNGTLFVPGFGMFNTYSTLNYTNTGSIVGGQGSIIGPGGTVFGSHLRFETVPNHVGVAKPAVNFINAPASATVAANRIEVFATNIVNRGILSASDQGRITLKGDNVDLSFSRLTNATPPGITDNYWGIGTADQGGGYSTNSARSPVHEVERVAGGQYFNFDTFLSVSRPQIFARTNIVHANTSDVQIVFFRPPFSTNISGEVKFLGGSTRWKDVVVQWSNTLQHAESQILSTNLLYLRDRLATMNFDVTPLILAERETGTPTDPYTTFIPTNYTLTTVDFSFPFGPLATNVATNTPPVSTNVPPDPAPPVFAPIREVKDMLYTSWSATLRGNTIQPITNTSPGASITNVAGRIEVIADKTLDLSRARMTAENYLLLRATNHFVGSPRSYLSSPYYDLDLASTNRVLKLDGVIPDDLGRYNGDIRVWSGLWSYTVNINDEDKHTNYHVVIIDSSSLEEASESIVRELKGRAPEIILGDIFNIEEKLFLDCESLTITNGGALNFFAEDITWSSSIPNLRNLTNYGRLSADAFILSRNALPNAPFGTPYDSIVNYGTIEAGGLVVDAHLLINSGSLTSSVGSIEVRFDSAIITNDFTAYISADQGGISLNGQSLVCANTSFTARDKITINVAGNITDGGIEGNNWWQSGDGFALPVKPGTGDLLGTLIQASAEPWSQVEIRWAGEDRGASSSGFQNNAAVGELWLDGGMGSQFKFSAADGFNAIYVEDLMIGADLEADLLAGFFDSLAVDSNFTVYFRNLWALVYNENGDPEPTFSSFDPSEFESKTGGRVRWMGGARTAVNLRDSNGNIVGTINVDIFLRESATIDSDADGIVNKLDTFPFDGPVLNTQLTPTGGVLLQWNAAANTTYSLWSTQNFTNWQKVSEVTSGPVAGPLVVPIAASTNANTFKVSYSP